MDDFRPIELNKMSTNTDRVEKCHGFDGFFCVKISAFWGKKVGRT